MPSILCSEVFYVPLDRVFFLPLCPKQGIFCASPSSVRAKTRTGYMISYHLIGLVKPKHCLDCKRTKTERNGGDVASKTAPKIPMIRWNPSIYRSLDFENLRIIPLKSRFLYFSLLELQNYCDLQKLANYKL